LKNAVASFENFCILNRLTPFPATSNVLIEFITKSAIADKSADAIQRIIDQIKSHHTDLGYDLTVFSDKRIVRLLKGVKNVKSATARHGPEREPITLDIAERLLAQCEDTFDGVTMRAAICVALAGFLRVGDFTYRSWSATSHLTHVSRGSVSFANDSVTLLIPRTKTERNVRIPMAATNHPTCPRSALWTLFTKFPLPHDAPLFGKNHPTMYLEDYKGSRSNHFTNHFFRAQLTNYLVKSGMDPTRYNTHSFRRGAAHMASAAGLPDDEIQLLGRWKTSAFLKYTGSQEDRRLRVAKKVHFDSPAAPRPSRSSKAALGPGVRR
jgi:hypothetical protein